MKRCTHCGDDKLLDEYYDILRYGGGKSSWCKECCRDYERNKETANIVPVGLFNIPLDENNWTIPPDEWQPEQGYTSLTGIGEERRHPPDRAKR